MDQFKAIESVRMSVKHAKRKKEMGKKMDPGRVRLGKKMDRLEEYFFSNFLFIIFRNGDRYLQRIMVIKKS